MRHPPPPSLPRRTGPFFLTLCSSFLFRSVSRVSPMVVAYDSLTAALDALDTNRAGFPTDLPAQVAAAFVVGGAEVFNQALPLANRMFLTSVVKNPEDVPCDTFFEAVAEIPPDDDKGNSRGQIRAARDGWEMRSDAEFDVTMRKLSEADDQRP